MVNKSPILLEIVLGAEAGDANIISTLPYY